MAKHKLFLPLSNVMATYETKPFDPFYGNYIMYSPGLDRIIFVDQFDPYTAVETAQILSSKISLVVGTLKNEPEFKHNCLEYTLKDKNIMFASSSIFYSRQWPSFRRLNSTVEHVGWPDDYVEDVAKESLNDLQEFAIFVSKCVKAVRITNLIFNVLPSSHIINELNGVDTSGLHVPVDQTEVEEGVSVTILRLLYKAKDKKHAIKLINEFWSKVPDVVLYRNQFYQMIGEEQSDDLKANRFSGRVTGFAV